MQLDPSRFARAVRLVLRQRDRFRATFDVELSDGRRMPAIIERHGADGYRLRLGPQTLPDYGLVVTKPEPLDLESDAAGRVIVQGAASRLILEQEPLRIVLERSASAVLTSITDEHFRGWSRLPAFGCDGERWIAATALASGEPVYGLGEKFSSLNRRGQLLHSQVEDALGVNTGCSYKNAPFCWSPGGALVHMVSHVRTLKPDDVSGVVGVSLRTVQRRTNAPRLRLSQEQSGRTWKFAEILAKATDVFGDQTEAENWLTRPAMALDDRRPADLLSSPVGVEMVEQLLGRLEHGVYT